MAYNNRYQGYGYPQRGYPQRGYPQGGYPQGGYSQQTFIPFDNVNKNRKKKSGAKELRGTTRDGVGYFGVSAWFYRKSSGLVSITAFESSRSTHFETQTGRRGVTLMFEVFYKDSGVKRLCVAPYMLDSGKAYLKELGILISTKAKDGGFAGYWSKNQDYNKK